MPVLKQCCCCVPLRDGGLVLGILSLVGSVVSIMIYGFLLLGSQTHKQELRDALESKHMDPSALNITQTGFALLLGTALIYFVCAVLLIFGAAKGRHGFLLPYLLVQSLGNAFMVMNILCGFPNVPLDNTNHVWISQLAIVLVCGLNVYLWLCVLSLYQHLKNDKRPKFVDSVHKSHPPPYVALESN